MQDSTADFKKGLRIVHDGQPYQIVDFQHVKPGKGGAFVRTKLKHMRLGRVIDNTFRAGEKVELVDFEERRMQYLYKDDRFHFMDLDTYDQISLSADEVGDARDFLKENIEVEILFISGSPVTVELPNFIELQIAKTDPGIRGDTATGGSKPRSRLNSAIGRCRCGPGTTATTAPCCASPGSESIRSGTCRSTPRPASSSKSARPAGGRCAPLRRSG